MVFVDLEKAFDRMPKDLIWWCLRKTENIEKGPLWAMLFAEALVLCAMTREEVVEDLETWRVVFERHGLKISRTKTEYLPSPTNDTENTVKIVDAELPTVT